MAERRSELARQRRELIADLIMQGATNREIARVVRISLATVRKVRHELGHAEAVRRGDTLMQQVVAELADGKRRL